jgi:hypothetical protein
MEMDEAYYGLLFFFKSKDRETYLSEKPIGLPKLISPLSIRMENPHWGLEHTQALYVMAAPSRP